MTLEHLVAIKCNNLIDNINHALENGRNAIKRKEGDLKGLDGISLIIQAFYLVAAKKISVQKTIDKIRTAISLELILNDIAIYIKIVIASLFPIVAEPMAEISSSEATIIFIEFIENIMNIANKFSDDILKLLRKYSQEDRIQLTTSFGG